jgi:hypothetical protein
MNKFSHDTATKPVIYELLASFGVNDCGKHNEDGKHDKIKLSLPSWMWFLVHVVHQLKVQQTDHTSLSPRKSNVDKKNLRHLHVFRTRYFQVPCLRLKCCLWIDIANFERSSHGKRIW